MPKISVIIPVFNTHLYLEQCLKSVSEQTFTDWEALVVNDGSTDDSALIINKWIERDSRFHILSQPNSGLSAARNTGLKHANGKYIFFLDSDDFLSPNALNDLYQVAEKERLDLTMCSFYEYDAISNSVRPRSTALELAHKDSLAKERKDSLTDFANFSFALPFAWNKLYLRQKIHDISLQFHKGAAEDFPFTVSYAVNCQNARFLKNKYLVYYRVNRKGSLSHANTRMLIDGIGQFAFLAENLRKYGVFEQVKETYWFNFMVLLIGDERLFVGRLGNVSSDTVKQAYDLIRPQIESLDLKLFANRNAMFRWKVRHFKQAVLQNDLKFPRRLRKIRNILMIVLNPWYKIKSRLNPKK